MARYVAGNAASDAMSATNDLRHSATLHVPGEVREGIHVRHPNPELVFHPDCVSTEH